MTNFEITVYEVTPITFNVTVERKEGETEDDIAQWVYDHLGNDLDWDALDKEYGRPYIEDVMAHKLPEDQQVYPLCEEGHESTSLRL